MSGVRVPEIAAKYGVSNPIIYRHLKGVVRTKEQRYRYGCYTAGCTGKHHANGYCSGCCGSIRYASEKDKIEAQRKESGYAKEKRYEKTINGFLVRTYRNMKSRVLGIQKKKHHLYQGKELLAKDAFYEWAKSREDFAKLYEEWKASGFKRTLSPSIDRIDSARGYTTDNMQWLTHSENSSKGTASRFKSIGKV